MTDPARRTPPTVENLDQMQIQRRMRGGLEGRVRTHCFISIYSTNNLAISLTEKLLRDAGLAAEKKLLPHIGAREIWLMPDDQGEGYNVRKNLAFHLPFGKPRHAIKSVSGPRRTPTSARAERGKIVISIPEVLRLER